MRLRYLNLCLAALVLSACDRYSPPGPDNQPSLVQSYLLDAGDQLRVTVPLIGKVNARNTTTGAIADEIETKLKKNYVKNPDVSVEVARYRPFFIMGEVVQQAVAIAGGFSPRASRGLVDVTRQVAGREITMVAKLTDPVLPGDTVNIRERLF
jgi:polysaccharide export outer membrane protein